MEPTRQRVLTARVLAVVADAVQLGLLPLFAEGAASVVNDVLDVAVAVAMISLVGWHWAFLPAFLAELVPVADLAPTWTLAVFLATRGKGAVPATATVDGASPARPEPAAPRSFPPVP